MAFRYGKGNIAARRMVPRRLRLLAGLGPGARTIPLRLQMRQALMRAEPAAMRNETGTLPCEPGGNALAKSRLTCTGRPARGCPGHFSICSTGVRHERKDS